jgi:signal peptidase II
VVDEAAIATPAPGDPSRPLADERRPRWALFAGLAAAVLLADQIAKAWIVANVDPVRPTPLIGEYVRLILSHNTGALFGLFRDQAPVFALFSVGVIGLLVWYQSKVGASALLSFALGLLLGGAVGNLADRVRLGYVVDFVDAGLGSLRFYTFNVADAAISTALLLLILAALRPSLAGPPDPERGTDA